MEEIKRMVDIIATANNGKVPSPSLKNGQSPTMEQQFILGVQNGQFTDDTSAVAGMYPDAGSNWQRYRMLKSRVRAKLLDMMLLLRDGTRYREYLQSLLMAQAFLKAGDLALAERYARRVASAAEAGAYTDLELIALRILRHTYGAAGKSKHFKRVQDRIVRCESLRQIEDDAVALSQMQSLWISKSANARQKHLSATPGVLDTLWRTWKDAHSSNVLSALLSLLQAYAAHSEDYSTVLECALAMEKEITEKTEQKVDALALNSLIAFTSLKVKSYEQGLRYAGVVLDTRPQASQAWNTGIEWYCICALRLRRFGQADSVCLRMIEVAQKRKDKAQLTHWTILKRYIRLYSSMHGDAAMPAEIADETAILKRPKDPSLAIRAELIHVIEMLVQEDTAGFLEHFPRVSALIEAYESTSKTENDRLQAFGCMLGLLIEHAFDPKSVQSAIGRPAAKLRYRFDPYSPTEVIPFDELWRHVMGAIAAPYEALKFGKQ